MAATQSTIFKYLSDALVIEETVDTLQERLRDHDSTAESSKPRFEPLEEPELYARKPDPLKWYVPVLTLGPLVFSVIVLIWTAVFEPRSMDSMLLGLRTLLLFSLVFMIPMGIEWIGHMREASRYSRQCAQHARELEKIREENRHLQQEYTLDVEEWKRVTEQKRTRLMHDLEAALARRKEFYEGDGRLYDKYRSSSCIRILLDCFASGRRNELTGPNGAYDLLEEELFRIDVAATLHQFQDDASQKLAALYKLCYAAATGERTIRTTTTFTFDA